MAVADHVDTFLACIAGFIFAGWCFQWLIHIGAILYGKWKLHRKSVICAEQELPGVSILKPLTGVDPHLFENIESYFNMDYPSYELLFCVEDDSDPAIMVVQSLLQKYPHIPATLFTGGKKVGVNPKINNMVQGYDAAKFEHILVSDSGVKMKEDTLLDIVGTMKENVGLVHQMPYVSDRKGFAGVLEKVYFGTQFAKMYLTGDLYGINTCTGKSVLIRREVLEDAGGLRAFAHYLAEDFYLAQACVDRGWKMRICSQPAWQNPGGHDVSAFQARMMRWCKLRVSIHPWTMLLEPVSECMVLGIITSWAVSVLFSWSAVAFFFVHTLVWFLLDYFLLTVVENGPVPFSKSEFVMGWLFRELMALILIIKAHSSPMFVWRTKKFYVKPGGLGEEVHSKSYV